MEAPAYLQPPPRAAITYGTVDYDPKADSFIVNAHPAALEMAKRLFPGSTRKDAVVFKCTRRAAGDLNLLLLRYPMDVRCPDRYEQLRVEAVHHAIRRENNQHSAPITPPATFTGTLIAPYQPEGVGFMVRNQRCLLADDMGTGKTIQSLAAACAADAFPLLVVCPPSLTIQWMRQAGVFLKLPGGSMFGGDKSNGRHICRILRGNMPKPMAYKPVTICHYLQLQHWRDWLRSQKFKAVIFDEIQELRHATTSKYSAASILAGEVDYVWGLSGTPIYNYGAEIWAIMNILDFHCLGSDESFSREWCVGYGQKIVKDPAVLGDYLRTEGLMLRRRKEDVQSSLPPVRRVVTAIEKNDDVYRRMVEKAVQLSRKYEHIKAFTEKGQARREIDQIERQATGIAKAPFVAAFVKTLLEADEKVLVYAHHHAVHNEIATALKDFGPVIITGQQTQGEKEAAIKAFADGKTPVVLLSLRASAGIDGLQGRGTCVVFAELDWSPAVHAQCEARLHRIGFNGESLLCYYLVSDSGSDEVMQEALGLKLGQFVQLMGDKGETDADRDAALKQAERHIDKVIERLRKL